jgi:ferrous iron transport protein A
LTARRVQSAARATRALDDLQPGESSIITSIDGEPHTTRRLMELGLVPGTRVEVVRRAPMGDPVELRVRRTHLSIRRSEAERVHVESD